MATIKFTDYRRLRLAFDNAEKAVRDAEEIPENRTMNVRNAENLSIKLLAMLDLYDFARNGRIYINSGEASLIKRFAPERTCE